MNQEVFSQAQVDALQSPLSGDVVKTREQSGRTLSYIEGWWAISEANRIFGFGGWSQEVLDIKCVSERERKIGRGTKDGWGVSYVATIRVVVNGVKREGVGAGHGIDVDLGIAHESAIKEAATDALKRALMTFGNQFGLALYDKDKKNVEDGPPSGVVVSESERKNKEFVDKLFAKMELVGINADGIKTLLTLLRVVDFAEVKESLRPKLIETLSREYAMKLNSGQNMAGAQIIEIKAAPAGENTESGAIQ